MSNEESVGNECSESGDASSAWSIIRNDHADVRIPRIERYLGYSGDDRWADPFDDVFYNGSTGYGQLSMLIGVLIGTGFIAYATGFLDRFQAFIPIVMLLNVILFAAAALILNHRRMLFDRIKLMAYRAMNNGYGSRSKRHTVILRDYPHTIMLSRFDGNSIPGWFNDDWSREQSGSSGMRVVRSLSLTPFRVLLDDGSIVYVDNHYLVSCNSRMTSDYDQTGLRQAVYDAVSKAESLRKQAVKDHVQGEICLNDPRLVVWKELPLDLMRMSPWDRIKSIIGIRWAYGRLRRKLRRNRSLDVAVSMMKTDDVDHNPVIIHAAGDEIPMNDSDVKSAYDLADRISEGIRSSPMSDDVKTAIITRFDNLMMEVKNLINDHHRNDSDTQVLTDIISGLSSIEDTLNRETRDLDVNVVMDANMSLSALSNIV